MSNPAQTPTATAALPAAHRCGKADCSHCNGTGWIGDIKCPACS
ncbi:hypothetical protein [Streptomyces halstedii]|nr:hypothetical protein [Streptomyces halstedii]